MYLLIVSTNMKVFRGNLLIGGIGCFEFCIVGVIWVRHLDLDRVGRAKLTWELKINMV